LPVASEGNGGSYWQLATNNWQLTIMNNQDPIADMLTRLRNANRVGRRLVLVRKSKICTGIAQVLKDEGYIDEYDLVEDASQGQIRIKLKYSNTGEKVIHAIDRASKPGRRIYNKVQQLPNVLNGMGIAVVSTSKGVMSDRKAREANVGGELLCTVS
jgi:small subunit ribosomal protein S8